jgi:hypothetical protein
VTNGDEEKDDLSQSQLMMDCYPRDPKHYKPAESTQIPESEANQKIRLIGFNQMRRKVKPTTPRADFSGKRGPRKVMQSPA